MSNTKSLYYERIYELLCFMSFWVALSFHKRLMKEFKGARNRSLEKD